ncbi:MAG: D-glucuronyl C5-epimerase family protein [Promethearchaeota archaeon]
METPNVGISLFILKYRLSKNMIQFIMLIILISYSSFFTYSYNTSLFSNSKEIKNPKILEKTKNIDYHHKEGLTNLVSPDVPNNNSFYKEYDIDGWKIVYKDLISIERHFKEGIYQFTGEYVIISLHDYELGWKYNPVTTAFFALFNYQINNYSILLKIADFLMKNMTNDGFFLYNWKIPLWHKQTVPWVSGLAQGLIIQVLLRAEEVTGNSSYLEGVNKVLETFTYEWEEGGITFTGNNYTREKGGFTFIEGINKTWFLESPCEQEEDLEFILNGHIYAIFGLYEYSKHPRTQKKALASQLFYEGSAAIESSLPEYDTYFGLSKYARKGKVNFDYLKIHVFQLEVIYRLTNNSLIRNYYNKWRPSVFINSEFSPQVVSFNAINTTAGVRLSLKTDIPTQIIAEWGEAGYQTIKYINTTLDTSRTILIKAPVSYRVYYRLWIADQNNITRLYPKTFNLAFSTTWGFEPSPYQPVILHLEFFNTSRGILVEWTIDRPVRIEIEWGVAGYQELVLQDLDFKDSGQYEFIGLSRELEYYYRFYFIDSSLNETIFPIEFMRPYYVLWKPIIITSSSIVSILVSTMTQQMNPTTTQIQQTGLFLNHISIILFIGILVIFSRKTKRSN